MDLYLLIITSFLTNDRFMDCLSVQMDGFALPPFESTCIFRDKDIIRYFVRELNLPGLWVVGFWLCRTPISNSPDANAILYGSLSLPFYSGCKSRTDYHAHEYLSCEHMRHLHGS